MKDILIVEDGRQERERLETLFVDAGYTVTACESVGDAESALEGDQFRMAILDIGLNDKSGSYLFNSLKQNDSVSYIIIFTGNPSVHLKQRFLDEGAIDYVVKASPQASNDQLLNRVQELLGETSSPGEGAAVLSLQEFLNLVPEKSKQLFYVDGDIPACTSCGANEYVVRFSHQPQMPPEVNGIVVCSGCGEAMDPEIK